MPILHITLDNPDTDTSTASNTDALPQRDPAEVFGVSARVPAEYVTVHVHQSVHQSGNEYRAMVQLVLPDLLLPEARERMLQAAVDMLQPCFGIAPEEALGWLTVVPSGQVLDRGLLQKWDNEPPMPPGPSGG